MVIVQHGSIVASWGETFSARDLARFGLLYLRHGRWHDEQVIPAEWVDESTRPFSTTNFASGYGYLWWNAAPGRLPAGSYFAAGNGGQYVFVIPADDLVVVHLARMKSVAGGLPTGVEPMQMFQLLSLILPAEPATR